MTRFIIHLLLLSCISTASLSRDSAENNESVFQLMDRLAATRGLEAVYGDKFPAINLHGSYGSPYVYDFIYYGDIEQSILFLARKSNEFYDADRDAKHSPGDFWHTKGLLFMYDYFLVFAVKESNAESFVVRDVLDDGIGLKGMSLYYDYGAINLGSIQFSYIEDGSTIDGSALKRRKLSIPILISAISSTQILFYYDGKWIEHAERDI